VVHRLDEFERQDQRSKVKVTRYKNVLSTPVTPGQSRNGMHLLQTACSNSGRHHFVPAGGNFRGLRAGGLCLVKHL